ncbi:MAG: hypothetical protein J1F63_01325 [Oscillospiraceae bacterium]|nr:hypothetical protein [Oscillospiraceae bacterium]
MKGPYDDIIDMPHHVSKNRPHMSAIDRAAQFSPFAALTGHSAAINETARRTDKKLELDEHAKAVLDMKQHILLEELSHCPEVRITYFVPDERKAGGEYVNVSGKLKRIDEHERVLVLTTGERIPFDDIVDIESGLFYGRL